MKKSVTAVIGTALALSLFGCAHETVEKTEAKKEIIVICNDDMNDTLKNIMKKFTNTSTATRVKLVGFSNASAEVYWKTASMLADEKTEIDAMIAEDVWVQGFIKNGYLSKLCTRNEFPEDTFPKGIGEFIGDSENVYWYPLVLDTGILYYRSDKTELASDIFADTGKSNLPYVVQGSDGEEMLCCALEYVNLTHSVKDGLQLYKKVLDSSVGSGGEDYITEFTSGNAMYMRAWASDYNKIASQLSSQDARAGVKLLTTGDGSEYSVARAYGYAVNDHSDKKENCMELLEYIKSDEVQTEILKGMKTLPIRRKDYDNPVILDYSSYNSAAAKLFDTHTFRPARAEYANTSRKVRKELARYLRNEGTLEEAAAAVESLLNQ